MTIKKSKIYRKIFFTHIIIIVFLIFALDLFFIKHVYNNISENRYYINEKVAYDVNDVINKLSASKDTIIRSAYSNVSTINDIIDFLNTNKVTYLKNKLDKFSNNNNYFYNGIENFVKLSFTSSEDLQCISFISFKRSEENSFNRINEIIEKRLTKEELENSQNISNITYGDNVINFKRRIRSPINLKDEGILTLTYNLNELYKIVEKYDKESDVIILDNNKNIVYSSKNKLMNQKFEALEKMNYGSKELKLDRNYYINIVPNKLGLKIISITPKVNLKNIPFEFYRSLIIIDLIVYIISRTIIFLRLKKINSRIDNVIFTMDKVKNGNFNAHIPLTNDNDEINYISENFNEMCDELNKYIEKSYLAKIKEKKAEMLALQSQINPHFLYNTLESIRMKAICNDDKEVSNMLYSLAFLFRKQVKDKDVITIKDEIEYCKRYIEIFKFRFFDKFDFKIECEEDLLNKQILKFTIQPLIENYFIHGIRLCDRDNLLSIKIYKNNFDINIVIEDNGNGINEEKACVLNKRLKNREYEGKSIGVSNSNERIIIAYGVKYGIRVKRKEKGIKIIINIPCREV